MALPKITEEERDRLESVFSRSSSTGRPPSLGMESRKWNTRLPYIVENTLNPIRHILEQIPIKPHPDLPMIPLSIGDPSVFGNFPAPKEATQAVVEAVASGKSNGYGPSMGSIAAREAISKYLEPFYGYVPKIKEISLSNGASGALEFAISALADRGQNILIPSPGFPLYEVLAKGQGIQIKYYDLCPDFDWDVDNESLENAIDDQTAAVVFINPSNPCGAVFSRTHMEKLVDLCDRYRLPIIADEIYAGMVFPGREFTSFASVSARVPMILCGGLAKRFLVPGWRLGWTVVHDPANIFRGSLSTAIHKLTTRLVGPNTVIQAAIPDILHKTPQSWHDEQNAKLASAAEQFFEGLLSAPGLRPIMPSGAMYMMVGIDMERFPAFSNDMEFVETLIAQKSVFCLPGKCFGVQDFIRIVITIPDTEIPEVIRRIVEFCDENCEKETAKPQNRRVSAFLIGGNTGL